MPPAMQNTAWSSCLWWLQTAKHPLQFQLSLVPWSPVSFFLDFGGKGLHGIFPESGFPSTPESFWCSVESVLVLPNYKSNFSAQPPTSISYRGSPFWLQAGKKASIAGIRVLNIELYLEREPLMLPLSAPLFATPVHLANDFYTSNFIPSPTRRD